MPAGAGGGLGNALMRSKKKKAEASRARYRDKVEAARAMAHAEGAGEKEKAKKLTSIWESSNMDEFLAVATEREAGFTAERNVRVVVGGQALVVQDDRIRPLSDNRDWLALSEKLTIPKRPQWDFKQSADEIQAQEKAMFINWRRNLSAAEESEKVVLTPYEKNLEVWRQLWRVVERSDVVLEILDARNPLVFRSKDFENYVASHKNKAGKPKKCILLLNKADLLTERQRQAWAQYFESKGFEFFFFSASDNLAEQQQRSDEALAAQKEKAAQEKAERRDDSESEETLESSDGSEDDGSGLIKERKKKERKVRVGRKTLKGHPTQLVNPYFKEEAKPVKEAKPIQPKTETEIHRDERTSGAPAHKSWDVLTPEQLLDHLAAMRPALGITDMQTPLMTGLVGYPNVGKSSSINAIIGCKKVIVSATPGKTKHFQTLTIPEERRVMLCDCPGLVFPSFAATRETMVCDGVLPVDTVKDYVSCIAVVAKRIPKVVFERIYNIKIDPRKDLDDSTCDADLMLNFVARRRNYMTDHDKPNRSKAAKEILKMYVDGELVYVHPPPGYQPVDDEEDEDEPEEAKPSSSGADVEEDEEEEDDDEEEGEWEDVDEEDWEEIGEAEQARGLDQQDPRFTQHDAPAPRAPKKVLPTFLTRPKSSTLTLQEKFNADSNGLVMPEKVHKNKKKKVNPQLEPDFTYVINEDGKKELLIDSDDGIVELEAPEDAPKKKEKKPTKKQLRREQKRSGGALVGAKLIPGL